jgi:hypothetical protein
MKKKILLLLIIFLLILSNNKAYTFTRTQKFCDEPVLIEIVTADFLIGREIIEEAAKEIEDISLRKIAFITYIEDRFSPIQYKDGNIRSSELMKRFKTMGLPIVLMNGQFFFQGYGGNEVDDGLEELKTYYKKLFLQQTSKIPYDESFILKETENIRESDGSNKLRVKLEAVKDFNEKELSNTNILIFLIADPVSSCYFKDANHRNVAFMYIPVEGFEYEEFNGIGTPITKVIGKDSISRRDKINITSNKFTIDEKLKANWSVLIIIENAEKKNKLFARELELNDN